MPSYSKRKVTYGNSWWNPKVKMRLRYAYIGKAKVGVIGTKGGYGHGRRRVVWMKKF